MSLHRLFHYLVGLALVSNTISFITVVPCNNKSKFLTSNPSVISIGSRFDLYGFSGTKSERLFTTSMLFMVASITLEKLSDNHELIGQEMAESIVRWLDKEWMPQNVHVEIAQQCKATYIASRLEGETDLMSIMTNIADDLNADWNEKYNKDSFVNAWDISNYVSDYLTSQIIGNDNCGCSAQIA